MNVQDFILMHSDTQLKHIYDPAEYDPQAAHDYYERNKQLKGRKRTIKPVSKGRSGGSTTLLNKHRGKKIPPKPVKSAKQRNAEAAAKLPNLQAKLDRLKAILSELVRQAKERAGVDTSKETTSANLTKDTKTSSTKSSSTSTLTAQQKREAAKRSQEWREAHKTPEEKAKALEEQIAEVTQKIKELRDKAPTPPPPTPKKKVVHTTPDKIGRPPGDPHYGEDPPATPNKSTKPVPRRGRS